MFDSFFHCPNFMSPGNYDIRYCFQVKLMARGKKKLKVPKITTCICVLVKRIGGYFQVAFVPKNSRVEFAIQI